MTSWEKGCSLKQDAGYESYMLSKSMAPFAYQMSCVAPAACPTNGPRYSECRAYAPGMQQVPAETALWRQTVTRGRSEKERRPQTVYTGTSAYAGPGAGPVAPAGVQAEGQLREGLWTGGGCRRAVMEHVPASRSDFLGGFVPAVEPFEVGGTSSRCNKVAYKPIVSQTFTATAPVPPAPTYLTGIFSPQNRT